MVNILGTLCYNANLVHNCLDKTVKIQNNIKKVHQHVTRMFFVVYYNIKGAYETYQIYRNEFSIP